MIVFICFLKIIDKSHFYSRQKKYKEDRFICFVFKRSLGFLYIFQQPVTYWCTVAHAWHLGIFFFYFLLNLSKNKGIQLRNNNLAPPTTFIFIYIYIYTCKILKIFFTAIDKRERQTQSHLRIKYLSHLRCSLREQVWSPLIFRKGISYSNTNGAICANSMRNTGADSKVCERWLGPGEEALHPKCISDETPGPWKQGRE